MWKAQGAEPMIYNQGWVRISCKGAPEKIDITTGTLSSTGQIEIRAIRTNLTQDIDGRKKYDWSFSVSVPSGGVILTQDVQPFLAPEEGYTPEVTSLMNKDNPAWIRNKEFWCYIKEENPLRYTRAKFDVATSPGNGNRIADPDISVTYDIYTNPSGSRNLEYEREKDLRYKEFYEREDVKKLLEEMRAEKAAKQKTR